MLVPRAVFPIEGLPAIIIKSELCSPPIFLSKSFKPVGKPAILPSLLYAWSTILIALLLSASLNKRMLSYQHYQFEINYKVHFLHFQLDHYHLQSFFIRNSVLELFLEPIPINDLLRICKSYNKFSILKCILS